MTLQLVYYCFFDYFLMIFVAYKNICVIERIVLKRLNDHLSRKNSNIPFQSAYKKHHSTETLLIRIVNDLLIATDENKATVVLLLDLSAAFTLLTIPSCYTYFVKI